MPVEPRDLGIHKGQPIKSETVVLRKGARVFRDVSELASFEVEDGQIGFAMLMFRQAGDSFEAVMSSDEPDKIIGYDRKLLLDVVGAAPDDREGTAKTLERMAARVADRAEQKRQEKAGNVRLAGIDPVPDDDGEGD
jgi:hypothetical protein